MIIYFLKILFLFIFSAFIGYNYYNSPSVYSPSFNGYIGYFVAIAVVYGVYKYIQLISKQEFKISLKVIVGLFLVNLLILCIFFFSIVSTKNVAMYGFLLFFKILFYSILPIGIFLVSTSFGRFILNLKNIKHLLNNEKHKLFHGTFWILELAIGFISLVSLLVIFGTFGLYNIWIFLLIFLIFAGVSYKEILNILNDFLKTKFVLNKKNQLNLIITEFFYLIAFLVLGVGLISVVRPYPIGWDDLGVYMNVPHLIAESGFLLRGGGIFAWQTFTGIGYLFGSATQAFFLNFSSIVMCFIILNVVLNNLIEKENSEKSFLNLSLICATLYISLPMVGFHTKDMKLDEGLFFITVIGLFFLYKYFLNAKENEWQKDSVANIEGNHYNSILNSQFLILFLIGIIVGFAFSIKFTSLLLIVGVLGVISFARLGIFGFLGYLFVFLGVFTLGDLWKLMNVVVNPNNIAGFETNSGIGAIAIGLLLFFSVYKNKEEIIFYFKEIIIFLAGIILILLPWFGKNIIETAPNFSVLGLLNGKNDEAFITDYTKIYSEGEIERIKMEKDEERKKENLITTNEDLLRYFGYEKGIQDYVNMFWNLTMQKNQTGEYTNIGWLFLALIPLIFIFLPFKNKYYFVFFVFLAFLQIIFYVMPTSKLIDNENLKQFDKSVLSGVTIGNEKVFKNKKFNKDIYDIRVSDDYLKQLFRNLEGNSQVIIEAEQSKLKIQDYIDKIVIDNMEQIVKQFYADLTKIVKNPELGNVINNFGELKEKDFKYLQDLADLYANNGIFVASNIVSLKEQLSNNGVSETDKEALEKLWGKSRTFSGKITDFFAIANIPIGYVYLLIGFLIPTLFLIFTLKQTKLNYLFKLNLIFAFLYIFLWLVSSFGIVWYGITMYFSFFLMITLGAEHLLSYKNLYGKKWGEKEFGSIVFLGIILVYVFYSLFPYIFSNLAGASYADFKVGQVTQVNAIFVHQPDYAKMIFTMNISPDKRIEFFEKNIRQETLNANVSIGDGLSVPLGRILPQINSDINQIIAFLDQIGDTNAKISKENIYKGLISPEEEFRNKGIVYRIGTFLYYYISENNKRVGGDSLLFEFDNYIYNEDADKTINNLKNLGFKYLLVDLNSATIDTSIIHDLTKRYEHLLSSFVSNKIELVSTDSVCLEVALENYKNNGDLNQYMILAGVNYESYDENGNTILRNVKKMECLKFISNLLENNLIDENNYSFLVRYKNYFKKNELDINTLNSFVGSSYRALFEIK